MTEQRFAYEPVHDLRTGRFAGVEVVPRRRHDAVAEQVRDRGWSARQIAELDAGTAVSAAASARSASPAAPMVPVQVDVAADTVLHARDRLRAMLAGTAVAPLLEIGPAIAAAAPAEQLVPAIAELRRWGFRIALDGAGRGFGPELVAAVRPDVVKLEPVLADGVLDAGVAAAVRAVLEVAKAVGVPVAATGVRAPARLAGLYATGVAFAQGPLLGGTRSVPEPDPATPAELLALLRAVPGGTALPGSGRRAAPAADRSLAPVRDAAGPLGDGAPSGAQQAVASSGAQPVAASDQPPAAFDPLSGAAASDPLTDAAPPRAQAGAAPSGATPAGPPPSAEPPAAGAAAPPPSGPPVRGLATAAVTLDDDVIADTVRETMRAHPDSAGVVLVDVDRRPVGYLDRSRFLLTMAGRFGNALWADKPAAKLADPPRLVDERTPLSVALELSLAGDPARGYDDLVVVAPDGGCRGVVTVAELWRRAILPTGASASGHPPAAPRPDAGPGPRSAAVRSA